MQFLESYRQGNLAQITFRKNVDAKTLNTWHFYSFQLSAGCKSITVNSLDVWSVDLRYAVIELFKRLKGMFADMRHFVSINFSIQQLEKAYSPIISTPSGTRYEGESRPSGYLSKTLFPLSNSTPSIDE